MPVARHFHFNLTDFDLAICRGEIDRVYGVPYTRRGFSVSERLGGIFGAKERRDKI